MSPQSIRQVLRRVTTRTPQLISAALLLLMAVNFLTVIARKSITIDETLVIPAAYYHLKTSSFEIAHDHPPFPMMISGLPLLFLKLQTPTLDDVRNEPSTQQTVTAGERFWSDNRQHFQAIFFWARLPMIMLTLLLGGLVLAITRRLFNARAATLAVALFTLEPTILAHGRVVKDIHVAFAYLLFFFALYLYASAPSLKKAIFLGGACGLALAVKFSMLILFPILLAAGGVLIVRARTEQRRTIAFQVIIAVLVTLLALNASYFFRHQPLTFSDLQLLAQSDPALSNTMLKLLSTLSFFAPPYFVLGAFETLKHNDLGHPGFLLGQYSEHGWWYYFPVAFALKTSIPFLLLTVTSLAWGVWRASRRDVKFVVLLIPIVIYAGSAMLADINIGIRHLLPVFPFFFILGGGLLDHWLRAERAKRVLFLLVILIVVVCAEEAVRAYPNYIPYMNQFASTRPHWTYLSDSNIEWGDDNGALADYLKAKGETRVRAACLGGSVVLPLYGVQYVDLLSPPQIKLEETRYVAIGASFLNGSTVPGWSEGSGRETPEKMHNYFAKYRNRQPEAVLGGTIYLYRERE